MLFKGRNHIQIKAKCEMLKLYVYRPIFHVLSNGAHAFGVSLILCEDMEQTIHGNCAAFNLHFEHIHRTQLTGNPSAPFERNVWNFGLEVALIFHIDFVFVHGFCL